MSAFTFRGRVRIAEAGMEGLDAGRMLVRATAAEREGVAVWAVLEQVDLFDGVFHHKKTATLDRFLGPIEGHAYERQPEEAPVEVAWRAVDDGWRVERAVKAAGQEPVRTMRLARWSGPVTTTMAAFCLLCRHVLPDTGTFEVALLNVDEEDEDQLFDSVGWTVTTGATWEGRPVWGGTGRKGRGERLEVFLEPETEEVLGLRITTPEGRVMEIRGVEGEDPGEEIRFDRPARTAEEAALQAGLALATGDVDLIRRIVHWPSIHTQGRAEYDAKHAGQEDVEPFPDPDAYRELLLAQFDKNLEKRPRALIEGVLKGARDHLELDELEGGEVRVTFPPIFQNLVLVVRRENDVWYLSRLPSRP